MEKEEDGNVDIRWEEATTQRAKEEIYQFRYRIVCLEEKMLSADAY
jgi:hypothetical protein